MKDSFFSPTVYMDKELDRKRLTSSYPKDIKDVAYLISFDPDKLVFYGSQSKKAMYLSSGDIDLLEPVRKDEALGLTKRIQGVVRSVDKAPLCYLADFKSGVDPTLAIDIGSIKNGAVVGYNRRDVKDKISKSPIPEDVKDKLMKIIRNTMTVARWCELDTALHKEAVIRWNRRELLRGWKKVGGNRIHLEDTIRDRDSMTKIDVVKFLPSLKRFVEVTNYFHVSDNPSEFNEVKFIDDLRLNLIKCYYEGKYFKLAKRIMSYLLSRKDFKEADKLYDIIHSGLGIMYQIVSELDAILYVVEHYRPPLATIRKQLDAIRYRLGNIYEFDFDEAEVDAAIDKLIKIRDRKGLYDGLTLLRENLSEVVNKEALRQLKAKGFCPLKKEYYP